MSNETVTPESQLFSTVESMITEATKKALIPDIMGIGQAAQFTQLSKSTIYGKVCRREIPYRKKGNKLYFLKEELKNWMLND